MKLSLNSSLFLFTGLVALGCSDSQTAPRSPRGPNFSLERANGRSAFSINGTVVSASGEIVRLTGGGSFDPATANNVVPSETSGHGNGSFRCVTDITSGLIAGCPGGDGVRWDTVQLLASAPFKCGGVANEKGKTATTSDDVVVLLADFYLAGVGDDASFTAKMFVSKNDLADDVPGVQNVWIQGFGCGTAEVNFNN